MKKDKTIYAIQFLSGSGHPYRAGDYLTMGGVIKGFQSIKDAERTWKVYFAHNYGICNIVIRPEQSPGA